ncbi:MAG: ABC transporter permease [Clostridia bacterium]
MNMVLLLSAAIQAGTPLLLATVGESLTEKAGNLNLGVEGMMLVGAVSGFIGAYNTGSALFGILMAILSGILISSVYAFITVTLRANQIVTGLAITILGTGLAGFLGKNYVGMVLSNTVKGILQTKIRIPLLGDIPFVGDILFNNDIMIYMAFLIAVLAGLYISRTRTGLKLRAVGENPYAADAAGINVSLFKYIHIMIGGALCGLGGSYLSLVYIPVWQDNVVAGRGWIAVALVIFVGWNPIKAVLGAYVFGGLDILGFRLQKFEWKIPQDFIDMLPYIATIIVLVASSINKKKKHPPPSWLGREYFREDR